MMNMGDANTTVFIIVREEAQELGKKLAETNLFGKLVRSYRKHKKLSQVQLGNAIPIDPAYISVLENGERLPSLGYIIYRMSKVMSLDDTQTRVLYGSYQWTRRLRELAGFVNGAITDCDEKIITRSGFQVYTKEVAALELLKVIDLASGEIEESKIFLDSNSIQI